MTQSLLEMLPVLRCPRSHSALTLADKKLISEKGEEYPIFDEKPVLVKQISSLHITLPDKGIISQNIPVYKIPSFITDPHARILHLGSGNVPCPDPRVISLDVIPCENADIVAEAEALPFKDNSFDYVESGAVFEHLYDPLAAIKEVKRVLKEDGRFRIDTAFLQPYHGFPGHYHNLTPQAIETFLVDDFHLEQACVPDSATPLMTLLIYLDQFLAKLPDHVRADLVQRPLFEILEFIRSDSTSKNPLLATFDEYSMRALAASFVVRARKPKDYERRLAEIYAQGTSYIEQWQSLKRAYYTSRLAVMFRHHEALAYRRLSRERGKDNPELVIPENIHEFMDTCSGDMLNLEAVRSAIQCLTAKEAQLHHLRDQWIGVYLSTSPPEDLVTKSDASHSGSSLFSKLKNMIKRVIK